jgi:dsDNA-specific endonuclease/ATPase MutS2
MGEARITLQHGMYVVALDKDLNLFVKVMWEIRDNG